MAEFIRRMRNYWTRDEKASLLSLLDRFEEVLRQLLQPPPAESVYAPAARQAADHTRAAELFVSDAKPLPRAPKAEADNVSNANADQLECTYDPDKGGELL